MRPHMGAEEISSHIYPIHFVLRSPARQLTAEVVNYHHRGACLRVSPEARESLLAKEGSLALDFYLGKKCVKRDIPYRVNWETILADGLVGIDFSISTKSFIQRAERFLVNPDLPPTLAAKDPLDPNRLIFCRVVNVSASGMLISTSLLNKHLFPGMTLGGCQVSFPGQKMISVELAIVNTRPSNKKGRFLLGVQVQSTGAALKEFVDAMKQYVSMLSPFDDKEERLDLLSERKMLSKKLKGGLTFVTVRDEKLYERVLKLRYTGYEAHGKVKEGASWKDMGEGLAHEGTVLAAMLGGQIVASVELRFGSTGIPLRAFTAAGVDTVPGVDPKKTLEVNKLVVHPTAQGVSDIVLGMIQKCHAIILGKGGANVILIATDKLAPFYERIGFERTSVTMPHPTLPGVRLTLMCLKPETYMQAKHMNPLNWLRVYEANQKHMEGLGIVEQLELRSWQKAHAKFTEMMFRFMKWRSKGKKRDANGPPKDTPESNSGPTEIPPRWTAQHFIAPIMYPYLLEADQMLGTETVDEILMRLNMPRAYLKKQSNWVSIAFFDAFLDEFQKHGDPSELNARAGERSLSRDVLGLKYHFLKHFASPELIFQASAKVMSRFNLTRTAHAHSPQPGMTRLTIGLTPGYPLPKHRESCLNFKANFAQVVKVMTGTPGDVKKLSCVFDGARDCTYEISWNARRVAGRGLRMAALGAVALAGVIGVIRLFLPLEQTLWLIGGLALVAAAVMVEEALRRGKQNHKQLEDEFDKVEEEHTDRYNELQAAKADLDIRYREARLLETTAKAIQQTAETSRILRVSLDAVCEVFEFDRAFVMLIDDDKASLRTAAVAGIAEGLQDVWGYRVGVTEQKSNPLVLSSVYRTGNPVMINDVDSHLFQLNEASQRLIRRLNTKSFIMVPIPSETGNWGVMLVDKVTKKQTLTYTDLALLQKVAQHLGIALDKQAKLDRETALRRLFQKYVPPQIANAAAHEAQPALGGQLRQIVSLFLDIRDFTKLAGAHPPHTTVSILNQIWTHVSRTVTEHGGWIDKYLGDGVFVTWGAVGNSKGDSEAAVRAAFGILEGLAPLNTRLVSEGLPSVRVGIGIHCGQSVVGNIGSEERMEFTCIGSTVNISSRLQDLCKFYKASLVVSSAVLKELSPVSAQIFTVQPDVAIRGVADPMSIGYVAEAAPAAEIPAQNVAEAKAA